MSIRKVSEEFEEKEKIHKIFVGLKFTFIIFHDIGIAYFFDIMELKTRMNYTLDYTIKAGQSKIDGKILRCANKGITDIGVVEQASFIEKLFISTNLLRSLKGIEQFIHLKVLSISYNEIHLLSEIKYLKGLPLNTINLEGNHITQLPFYQYHVFVAVPTLMFFDGKNVSEKLRASAESNVEYDLSHLKTMCINEIRIQELKDLLKFNGEKTNQWHELVEKSLSPKSLDYYEISDNEIEERFDRLREQAFEIRNNDSSLKKWTAVYEKMEATQESAINNIVRKLKISSPINRPKSLIQNSKLISTTKFSELRQQESTKSSKKVFSNKESNNRNNQMMDHFRHQISSSKAQISELPDEDSKSFDDKSLPKMNGVASSNLFDSTLENMTLSPTPNSEIPQPLAKSSFSLVPVELLTTNHRKASQLLKQGFPKDSYSNGINQIVAILTKRMEFKMKSRVFRMLKQKATKHANSNPLQISKTISRQVSYRPSNYNAKGSNIELLEKAQALAEDISKLQADIEFCDKENNDVCAALEKSVKTEEQLKSMVKKLMNENRDLTQRLQKSEARYEEDVMHYMLESKFKFGQQELQLAELERIIEQKDKDIQTLKTYASELKAKYIADSNALKQKLTSAFDVASGYRNEISILKGESPPSLRQTPPRTTEVRFPSVDSSPDADGGSNSQWRKDQQIGFMTNRYNI